jgi:hypothetical protein
MIIPVYLLEVTKEPLRQACNSIPRLAEAIIYFVAFPEVESPGLAELALPSGGGL